MLPRPYLDILGDAPEKDSSEHSKRDRHCEDIATFNDLQCKKLKSTPFQLFKGMCFCVNGFEQKPK